MLFQPSDGNLHQMRALIGRNDTNAQIMDYLRCSLSCVQKWRRRIAAEAVGGPVTHDIRNC